MQISLFANKYAGFGRFFRAIGIRLALRLTVHQPTRHKALVQSLLFRMSRPVLGLPHEPNCPFFGENP